MFNQKLKCISSIYILKSLFGILIFALLLIFPFNVDGQRPGKARVERADTKLAEADKYYNKEDYNTAAELYKQIIQINPNKIAAYNGLGLSYFQLHKYSESIAVYQKAIDALEADRSVSSGKDAALSTLYGNLGIAYFEAEKYNEAVLAYKLSARYDSKDSNTYNALGRALVKLTRYEEAVTAYLQALQINSKSESTYIGLAISYTELGMYEDASLANKLAIKYTSVDERDYVPASDAGVDIAVVIAPRTTLHQDPRLSSNAVINIGFRDTLVLLDPVPQNSWYNVIDIDSGKEGWIEGELVKTYFTKSRKAGPILQSERTSEYNNPEVNVVNDSEKTMTIKIANQRYVIEPYQKKGIVLTPGNYKFHGSAPGVIPRIGERKFEAGYTYTWTFYIVTNNK